MRRKQLIQILQFVAVWIIVRILVVFVAKQSFVGFILKYWLYLLIVSVSYFYYYSIEYELDKKYEFIRKCVVYGNVYLFAHIFFRPLLNISPELFIALGLIILGLWGTTKIKAKWRIILQILGSIISFFILISGMFYLYPEAPDIKGFISGKKYELSIIGGQEGENDAFLQISMGNKKEQIQVSEKLSKEITQSCTISYPSLQNDRNENVLLSTPEGDIVYLFPQSQVELQFSGGNMNRIIPHNGKIGFFTGIFDSKIEFLGTNSGLSDVQQDFILSQQENYQSELIKYLKLQISDSAIDLANSTIMYNIDGKILQILSKLFPASFSKNLQNYNEFQKYFSLQKTEQINVSKYFPDKEDNANIQTLRGLIKNDSKVGKQNVYKKFGGVK